MNGVDYIIILALMFFSFGGFNRPLILESLDLLSFLLAFFTSFTFYNLPAKFFETEFKVPNGLSLVLGFMAVWFLTESIFYIIIKLILPNLRKYKIWGLHKFSFIPAFLRGLIFSALVLVLIATFPVQPNIKKVILDSKIGSIILQSAYGLEAPVKNIFGGVGNESLTFLTIQPKTAEKINLGFQTNEISPDEKDEGLMIDLVNLARATGGIKTLTFDKTLQKIARNHSEDMFKRGYFSHYSPEGLTVADRAVSEEIDFIVIGENLAYAPALEFAHKGLMNSEGHRANILSTDYNKIGVGVFDGGVYGKLFTQVFSN